MGDGGRTSKPIAAHQPLETAAQESVLPEELRSANPSKALGPARFDGIRAERDAATAQIHRSLKAWRAANGTAAATTLPKGAGAPLPSAVRSRMEPKLGAGLGGVRIHTDNESAESAKGFGARAFTVGEDVHFNAGEYNPGTKEGDRLLAHELTHVIQGQKSGIQRKADAGEKDQGAEVSDPGEPAEKEADAVGDEVADKLHGDDKGGDAKPPKGGAKANGGEANGEAGEKAGEEEKAGSPGEEKAPEIGAKLQGVGRKIYLGRPTRDPATPRQDRRPIPGSVSTQQGVEILVQAGALNHILQGHTVENFDPVTRLTEIGAGTMTSLFPPGFATNAQEIITVVKQALGNRAGRNFEPADRRLEVTLKKVNLEVWVGAAGPANPGAYKLNSCFPTGGVQLTYAEVRNYATQVNSRTRTLQQIRTELLRRFR